jgi:hypothetical protein
MPGFTTTVVNAAAPPLATASRHAGPGALTLPVTGARRRRTLSGAFELQRFAVVHGAVVAVGLLNGTLETGGGFMTSLARVVRLPVHVLVASCEILHLELGPLPLDILGVNIDLGRSVLDLTAAAGGRKLPATLLCPVAGLVDDAKALARQLNAVLAALQH